VLTREQIREWRDGMRESLAGLRREMNEYSEMLRGWTDEGEFGTARRTNPASTATCWNCGAEVTLAHNKAGIAYRLDPELGGPLRVDSTGVIREAGITDEAVPGLKGNVPRALRGTHKIHTHGA
jgi:hypothetical protein